MHGEGALKIFIRDLYEIELVARSFASFNARARGYGYVY